MKPGQCRVCTADNKQCKTTASSKCYRHLGILTGLTTLWVGNPALEEISDWELGNPDFS